MILFLYLYLTYLIFLPDLIRYYQGVLSPEQMFLLLSQAELQHIVKLCRLVALWIILDDFHISIDERLIITIPTISIVIIHMISRTDIDLS